MKNKGTDEIIAIYTCKKCGKDSPMTDAENLRWFRRGTPVECPHCHFKEYGAIELKDPPPTEAVVDES